MFYHVCLVHDYGLVPDYDVLASRLVPDFNVLALRLVPDYLCYLVSLVPDNGVLTR